MHSELKRGKRILNLRYIFLAWLRSLQPVFLKGTSKLLTQNHQICTEAYGNRLVPSSPLFLRICWCGKNFHAPQFCKRNLGHDLLPLCENLEGLPVSLKFPKTSSKVFYWTFLDKEKRKKTLPIVSIVSFTQFSGQTNPCTHWSVLTHMISFAFGCSIFVVTA